MTIYIKDLPLKPRTINCLLGANITTIDELIEKDVKTLMSIEYMGRVSVDDLLFNTIAFLYGNTDK